MMGVLYWKAANLEEAKFLACDLSNDYAAYRRRAGKFLPRMSRLSRGATERRKQSADNAPPSRERLELQSRLQRSAHER